MPTASAPELLIHSAVVQQLARYTNQPPHALLITGAAGMGKSAIAQQLAQQVLGLAQALERYAYQLQLRPEAAGKAIGIEAVRDIDHFLARTVPSNRPVSRIIMIHQADSLTVEAQNALLKTLEEPPANSMLLLTASQPELLLPTIRSRVQQLAIQRPTKAQFVDWLQKLPVRGTQQTQIMAMSGGLPGLAAALVVHDQAHPLVQAAATARQILTATSFERLCLVDGLIKDKQAMREVLAMLATMAHGALLRSGQSQARWQQLQAQVYDAETALANGAGPKLVMCSLMLNM